jgi:hypothetical protein
MKEQHDMRGITVRNDRPFSAQTTDIDSLNLNIIGDGPNGTDSVKALAPLSPADRSRLGT